MPTVVITGSTRGLGFAMAERFVKLGYQVTLSGRNQETLDVATEKLSPFRDRILAVPCDAQSLDDVRLLWDATVERFGRVDIWINNAGINQPDVQLWDIATKDTRTSHQLVCRLCDIATNSSTHEDGAKVYIYGPNGIESSTQCSRCGR